MSSTYMPICLEEMQDVLREDKGWVMHAPPVTEVYFNYRIKARPQVMICVHSSIMRDKQARDCGKDAIRVSLVLELPDGRIVGLAKFKRVHRVTGWAENLKSRVMEALEYAKSRLIYCNRCGRIMSERTNSRDNTRFLGCTGYPECKSTRSIT